MRNPFRKKEPTAEDLILDDLLARLTMETDPKQYDALLKHYVALNAIKAGNSRKKLDVNTVVSAVASLLGVGAIVRHESLNNITSKALSFVPKPKA